MFRKVEDRQVPLEASVGRRLSYYNKNLKRKREVEGKILLTSYRQLTLWLHDICLCFKWVAPVYGTMHSHNSYYKFQVRNIASVDTVFNIF